MSKRRGALLRRWLAAALCSASLAVPSGCQSWVIARRPLTFLEETVDAVIAPPDIDTGADDAPPLVTAEPRRVLHPQEDQYWDATLEEVLQLALAQVAIIRDRNQFLSPSNPLLASPEFTPSAFDPAIQENGGPFGGRSVDMAQSDFDPYITVSNIWGTNELIQNNLFLSGGLLPGQTLGEDSAAFRSRIAQTLSTGGVLSLSHTWDYNSNNVPGRLYPSAYIGVLRAEYRQPLWAGAGSDFTSIAGPLWRNLPGAPLNQGVVIARMNTRISVLDFESRVQSLLKNVADAWWDLAYAGKAYESEVAARDFARHLWEQVKARVDAGLEGASAVDEAQARENFYERSALANDALTTLYQREGQLRRLIGLPVNDGRLIRPQGAVLTNDTGPDWHQALAEALTHRVELRRQQTTIETLATQLRAACSLTRPQLDFVSGYNLNGFGDNLFNINDNGPFPSAYNTLVGSEQTGWNLGFEFSMPLGFRAANSQVRGLELRLAKARAVLAAQELEISHELANAFQQLDRWLSGVQFQEARRNAAEQRVSAVESDYRAGRTSVDSLVRAQASAMEATLAYHRSAAEYRKSLNELNYRAGRLLDKHNVTLAEGIWDPDTYAATVDRNLRRVLGTTPDKPLAADTRPAVKDDAILQTTGFKE
jgi:outer membrane protein TolC